MRAKIGDWTKVTGGDSGIVYTEQGWRHFQCLTCAKVQGFIILENHQRRQLAGLGHIVDRCFANKETWIRCEGTEAHREYVEQHGHL